MAYYLVTINLEPLSKEFAEILYAFLDAYSFEGIHDTEQSINAYISTEKLSDDYLDEIRASMLAMGCHVKYQKSIVPDQNWNELWERNFEPVMIGSLCVIRASFHEAFDHFRYRITIDPKMAFGTGHHHTTRLMIRQMLEIDFRNKSVLDMGCGTGVLGILASLMSASEITAIDNDEWAYRNTIENADLNSIKNLTAIHGDHRAIPGKKFDVILANINRNVLLELMPFFYIHSHKNSIILLSGILEEDSDTIRNEAVNQNFQFHVMETSENWIVMRFEQK